MPDTPPLSQPLRCLIVDDDPAAIQVLRRCLERTPELTLAGTCADALAALDFLRRHPVDVLLLDVSLPVLSGLDLLQMLLHSLSVRPYTILVSATARYAVDAFTYSVTDFLLKPLSMARFEQAVCKLRVLAATPVEAAAPADFLFVRSGGQ